MITYKSDKEIQTMKEGGKILAAILNHIANLIKPGVSADALEQTTQSKIIKAGVKSAFLNYDTGYMGKYPSALCLSLNNEVVHGIPSSDKIFDEGDLVGIDCGIWYKNLCVDAALTVACGEIDEQARKLLNVTKEALRIAIDKCRVDNYLGDIGQAVEKFVSAQGFKVIKTLVGHGVGYKVHENPQIPNFFPFDRHNPKNRGAKLKQGMTLALEPMISISAEKTKRGADGYAAVTKDGSLSAHFEHTVAVTRKCPLVLTNLTYDNSI